MSTLGYLPDPGSFDADRLYDQIATAGAWFFVPGFRRLDPEYVRHTMEVSGSPRSPYFEEMRRQTLPPRRCCCGAWRGCSSACSASCAPAPTGACWPASTSTPTPAHPPRRGRRRILGETGVGCSLTGLKPSGRGADLCSMSSDPASRAAHRLLCGRLAGLLFLAGSVAGIPVNQLFDPAQPGRMHLITALGIVSGLVCAALPWDRIDQRWLHAVPIAAVEVAITMWGIGGRDAHAYLWFLVFIVVFVAFAFDDRRVIAGHVAWSVLAAAYPILLADATGRDAVIAEVLLAAPSSSSPPGSSSTCASG
jgi:hypothetical protein